MTENEIGTKVIKCAIDLHKTTGPGLLESVYEEVLMKNLALEGLRVQNQVPVPVIIHGERYKFGFRADILVENMVILELKSVEQLAPIHKKQLITYLKLTKIKLGYVLNFGAPTMREGIVRIINGTL
ncbi:MAG: GxxExxY protein [Puniceicoccaceae bacterium]